MAEYSIVGAKFVPSFANPVEWNPNNAYDELTVVMHNGSSYTSRKYVPVGTDITDTAYWMCTGNYNAQYESVKSQLEGTADSGLKKMIDTNRENLKNLNFVTPEMYYEDSDGTDWALAINRALASGSNVYIGKKYATSTTVKFTGNDRDIFGGGKISYSGTGYAVVLNGQNINFSVNVSACNGNGIHIDATAEGGTYCQYISFSDMTINAADKCVECTRNSSKWVNELTFYDVRFNGKYGFYFPGDYSNGGYRFIACKNEICSEAFVYVDNIEDSTFVGIRNTEAFNKTFLKANIKANGVSFVGFCLSMDKIDIPRTVRSLNYANGILFNKEGRAGVSVPIINGVCQVKDQQLNFNTAEFSSNPTYDYRTYKTNIIPSLFALKDGCSITLPTPFNHGHVYLRAFSSDVTFKIAFDSDASTSYTCDAAGFYEVVYLTNDYVFVNKLSSKAF